MRGYTKLNRTLKVKLVNDRDMLTLDYDILYTIKQFITLKWNDNM